MSKRLRSFSRLAPGLACLALVSSPGRAEITFNVSFDDPGEIFVPFYEDLSSNTTAAGREWGRFLNADVELDVIFRFDGSFARGGGRSVASAYLGDRGSYKLWEPGAAAELRTGIDANGREPDIEVFFNPDYLFNELWLDPEPAQRSLRVPSDRVDAISVFMHEIGHALGFIGWRDWMTGTPTTEAATPFDELVVVDGGFYFTGRASTYLYGDRVPLTSGNLYHVGNFAPEPGSDLVDDLMNGVVFQRGRRYGISPLDLAILQDLDLPVLPAVVSADFDEDGDVDGNDLLQMLLGFGATEDAMPADGDADFDGDIDRDDLQVWREQVGVGTEADVSLPAVPEPGSRTLLGMVVLAGSFYLRGPAGGLRAQPGRRRRGVDAAHAQTAYQTPLLARELQLVVVDRSMGQNGSGSPDAIHALEGSPVGQR